MIARPHPRALTARVQHDGEIGILSAFFQGWAVETVQLAPLSERTYVSCSTFRSHRMLRLEAGSALSIHGSVHEGCTCVVLSSSPDPAVRLPGMPLRVTDLVLGGAGAQITLFVPRASVVSFLIVPSCESVPRRALRICDDADAPVLAQHIRQQHSARSSASLAIHLSNAFAASRIVPVPSARVAAVMSACRYVVGRLPAALTLGELSRTAGVGERTLEYAFKEVCETTPMSFVRSLRLARSRTALLNAEKRTPINEVARASGFTHMGQFSRDYYRWFGETPSTTLARAKQS